MKKIIVAAALVVVTAQAQAEFPVGKVGFNLSPQASLDLDLLGVDGDDDGDGFGFYGEAGSDMLFVYAESQMSEFEWNTLDTEIDETRFGVGLRAGSEEGYLVARIEQYDIAAEVDSTDVDDDGLGVHIGGELPLANSGATLFGSVGLISLDDVDGNEFRAGVSSKISQTAQVYAAYRALQLDDKPDIDVEIADFRIGINLLF